MEYKHFSHSHNLIMHQIPQGILQPPCSGCKYSCSAAVYVCWQCSFFLHEQCYQATRSLKHPSHPEHPLTLLPYPTYPSNSFYCNSCEIIGTGISYSCADCEFDLHVHCAYSISVAPTSQISHQCQELVPPSWNGQKSNIGDSVPCVSVSDQYHSMSHDPAMAQNGPPPTSFHNPIASAYYPAMAPTRPPYVPSDLRNPVTVIQDPSTPQNGLEVEGSMHFSHPHNLSVFNFEEDVENEVTCSACIEAVVGKGYSCVQPNCGFHLHESCFHLKKEIQHNSHPEHTLTLLPFAPYNNENCEFTCNACSDNGTGFTYHCSICKFDLHTRCVNLPETVKRDDHEHVLKLLYSCPEEYQEDIHSLSCDICKGALQKDRWMYFCESCDYGTHLDCVDCVDCEECEATAVLDPQVQLQMLKLQMDISRQQAQFVASCGASLLSLV